MVSFGMLYWLTPRLFHKPLWSPALATAHFWLATIGIVLYTVAMWSAGLTEGLMSRAIDPNGQLQYPNFLDIVHTMDVFYWVRLLGGTMYLIGAILLGFNVFRTVMQPDATPAPSAVPTT
jgi:cbb3-type cytochrome oxidase subunit 1